MTKGRAVAKSKGSTGRDDNSVMYVHWVAKIRVGPILRVLCEGWDQQTLEVRLYPSRYSNGSNRPNLCHPACPGVPWEQLTCLRQVEAEMTGQKSP
jgi:hypothetical protein